MFPQNGHGSNDIDNRLHHVLPTRSSEIRKNPSNLGALSTIFRCNMCLMVKATDRSSIRWFTLWPEQCRENGWYSAGSGIQCRANLHDLGQIPKSNVVSPHMAGKHHVKTQSAFKWSILFVNRISIENLHGILKTLITTLDVPGITFNCVHTEWIRFTDSWLLMCWSAVKQPINQSRI